jgi:hypothetical protein
LLHLKYRNVKTLKKKEGGERKEERDRKSEAESLQPALSNFHFTKLRTSCSQVAVWSATKSAYKDGIP